jgi:DNA adenine methylase
MPQAKTKKTSADERKLQINGSWHTVSKTVPEGLKFVFGDIVTSANGITGRVEGVTDHLIVLRTNYDDKFSTAQFTPVNIDHFRAQNKRQEEKPRSKKDSPAAPKPARLDQTDGEDLRVISFCSHSGVQCQLINLIPPHTHYFEPFAGQGHILRNMENQAEEIVLNDINPNVIEWWVNNTDAEPYRLENRNAIEMLSPLDIVRWVPNQRSTFIFCDPPYMHESRPSAKYGNTYTHEMSEEDHDAFLENVLLLKCNVMILGYYTPLYDLKLKDWLHKEIVVSTRGGKKELSVWMNYYVNSTGLHDYSKLGADWVQRRYLNRKVNNLKEKLRRMPRLEAWKMLSEITKEFQNPKI